MKLRLFLLACAVSAAAAAAQLSDYASQWPLAATEEGAYALVLDETVYGELAGSELRDLAAFNADGQPLAFGPMPASYAPVPAQWREAVWFALPVPRDGQPIGADQLHLHIHRSGEGDLSLDARLGMDGAKPGIESATPAPADVRDLLVDVRAKDTHIEALDFVTRADAADFNLRIAIEASEDLEHWRSVVDSASLAQLRQSGQLLTRKRVEFTPLETSYLRVRTLSSQGLPLAALRLQLRPRGPRPKTPLLQWSDAVFVEREGNAYVYRMPARLPVETVNVALASDNSLAELSVSVRDDESRPWRPVGSLNAFRLRGAGLALDNEALSIGLDRSRLWRIEPRAGQVMQQPPKLAFGWRPETWLLLTHGRPPYVVAAGSQRAAREDFPLELLVSQVRDKYGADWQPAATTLGPKRAAGGEAARQSYDPDAKRTWLLWGVLLLGALGVVAMVLKLLRSPPAAGGD